jgi:NAD(P)H-hydrate epimerase
LAGDGILTFQSDGQQGQEVVSTPPEFDWDRFCQSWVLDVAQVRAADQMAVEEFGMSSLALMENAGGRIAQRLHEEYLLGEKDRAGLTVVLCGKGNNGGDGLVVARHLQYWGHRVSLWLASTPDQLSGDAACQYRTIRAANLRCQWPGEDGAWRSSLARELDDAMLIVDALLGTGAEGEPRPPMDWMIRAANQASGHRVAVDIPSGLNAGTGHLAEATFRAHRTYTLLALKPGLVKPEGARVSGATETLSIGVPVSLLAHLRGTGF